MCRKYILRITIFYFKILIFFEKPQEFRSVASKCISTIQCAFNGHRRQNPHQNWDSPYICYSPSNIENKIFPNFKVLE